VDWWLVIRTPAPSVDLYPLGDYEATWGTDAGAFREAQRAAGMAAHGVTEEWSDLGDGWEVAFLTGPLPTRGVLAAGTRHDGPPDPEWTP
jgi:hypothetical protein